MDATNGKINLQRKSQEDIISQLIFDISMLKVLVDNLQDRYENHTHTTLYELEPTTKPKLNERNK